MVNNWDTLSSMSTPIIQAAEYLVELAGLFHDFGKASQAFQDKLRNSVKKPRVVSEPLRHEYVSWWMLGSVDSKQTIY